MMGCGSSMDTSSVADDTTNALAHWQQNGIDHDNIVREFVLYDVQISKLEATCPGPRMATVEAWIEHLQAKRDTLLGMEGMEVMFHKQQQQQQQPQQLETLEEDIQLPVALPMSQQQQKQQQQLHRRQQNGRLPNGNVSSGRGTTTTTTTMNGVGVIHSTNDIVANTPNGDLANLAINLGVINDVRKASMHEDFFANLSESASYLTTSRYYTEILEHAKVRLKTLQDSYAELNELYLRHDGIIAFISGGTYMSRLEESIDSQLEVARDVRDKLGSALEQWRISGTLLRACANSSTQGLQQWQNLTKILNPKEKIKAALECRKTFQASLISLDSAQLSLPHVEFRYISNRQSVAVKHCTTYMITDIANQLRYDHTTKVFTSYESNMSKASTWLYETFNKTLRKDFDKAEETVRNLAKTLRDHREEIFTAASN